MTDIQLKPVGTSNFASIVLVLATFEDGRIDILHHFMRSDRTEEQIRLLVERVTNKIDIRAPRWAGLHEVVVLTTLWGWNNPLS